MVKRTTARRRGIALTLVLIAFVLTATSASGTPGQSAVPQFRLSNTGATGSEITMGITSRGSIFVGGWDHIARSDNDGLTWKNMGCGYPAACVAADRVLIVDRSTNRVFVEDTTLACTIVSWSDNLGGTWTSDPAACGGGVTDHAKIAVGKPTTLPASPVYPNIVYVCANGLAETPCFASVDGGTTFGPVAPANTSTTLPCAFQGAPVAAPDGTLYMPKQACGPKVFASKDNGLSWTASTVFKGPKAASGDTPDLAITPNGTLYYFWTRGDWKPYFARSTDGGKTWSKPVAVAPFVTSSLFPVIAAGANGKIGLAFYGTTDGGGGWDRNPGNAPSYIRWYLYSAVVTNAASAHPTVRVVKVTPHPVQIGCLSKLGSCVNGLNITDYIDDEVGPNGHLYIAYVNGCPASCNEASQSTADQAYVAVQTAGPSLG